MPFEQHFKPLPLDQIRMADSFWTGWQKVIVETTLPAEHAQLESTGRLENFRRAASGQGEHEGLFFNDSDVYKWLEACGYALSLTRDPHILKLSRSVTSVVAAAQEEDGYLNTFFQLKHPGLKWRNLNSMHEMYCAGHLVEAAVALSQAGEGDLLQVAIKLVDHMMSIFGPERRRGYCGHQEIELALMRLGNHTGDRRYVEFARWMVEQRGTRPSVFEEELADGEAIALSPWAEKQMSRDGVYSGEYAQDHAPIRQQTEVVGHAVRAMYFYLAAAELAAGDEPLGNALVTLWENLTKKRMYVTGGIGPSASNEGFTTDYDLPNLSAYAETCASIGLSMWGGKMLQMTGDSQFADVVERALFNGVLSGISASGDRFFYTNPLESRGRHERRPWFDCACCPPNIARMILSVSDFVAGFSEDSFYIHIPSGFKANFKVAGVSVKVTCDSEYPYGGKFTVRVDPEQPVAFKLRVRLPDWSDDIETELPGLESESEWEQGYAVFDKTWVKGDTLRVDLGMEPRWLESNPAVLDNLGRVALAHGPLIYCAEEVDNGFASQRFSADVEAPVEIDGQVLMAAGYRERTDFTDDLYAALDTVDLEEADLRLVPYHTWCNRGANHMQVWLRRA